VNSNVRHSQQLGLCKVVFYSETASYLSSAAIQMLVIQEYTSKYITVTISKQTLVKHLNAIRI
jgi:hypothetical protein